jgi:hypothetical protein
MRLAGGWWLVLNVGARVGLLLALVGVYGKELVRGQWLLIGASLFPSYCALQNRMGHPLFFCLRGKGQGRRFAWLIQQKSQPQGPSPFASLRVRMTALKTKSKAESKTTSEADPFASLRDDNLKKQGQDQRQVKVKSSGMAIFKSCRQNDAEIHSLARFSDSAILVKIR